MKNVVAVKLDKERYFKFGINSYIAIEEEMGLPMSKIDFESTKSIFAMIYGGLVWQDKKLTLDKTVEIVEELIEQKMEEKEVSYQEALQEVLEPITEAIMKAMGNKEGLKALPKK